MCKTLIRLSSALLLSFAAVAGVGAEPSSEAAKGAVLDSIGTVQMGPAIDPNGMTSNGDEV